jgi:hypothetical protein
MKPQSLVRRVGAQRADNEAALLDGGIRQTFGGSQPFGLDQRLLEANRRGLEPGFPIWIRPTRPKAAETLAKPRIPSFTRRVRQDWAT